ncbi:MAG: excinuclease ABC subunit UvrC [Gammaproteobacteria bacterium]|nr:excinuclease ABC subunit UvrC [Gammaproteobacteria bacterium]
MTSEPSTFDVDAFLATLTTRPGVYCMLNGRGQVLYVGKARNLKKRVSTYFGARSQQAPKTRALMANTARVEVTATHTETEALHLENNLIKAHRPRYNILLRDDKSFPYIYLSAHQRFPRLAFHRGRRDRKGKFFGPYASAGAVRETLTQLQKLFRVRQCDESFFRNRSRPCLQYQIKRCTAPCVGLIDESDYAEDVRHATMFLEGRSEEMIEELVKRMNAAAGRLEYEMAGRYRDQIASLRRVQERQYISGGKGDTDVVAAATGEGLAAVQIFVVRNGQSLGTRTVVPRHASGATPEDVLSAFLPQHYLSRAQGRFIPTEILLSHPVEDRELLERALSERAGHRVRLKHQVRGDRARWLDMARTNAELALKRREADQASLGARLEALQDALGLDEPPSRIECFDVSHTAGEAAVAACVVFESEGPVKSDYRRFNIKTAAAGDDYAAMREAIARRYRRLREEEGKLPDLILIDGGAGQVGEAAAALEELQLGDLNLVGVAKGPSRRPGLEHLHRAGRKRIVTLEADSPALHLIQQIRDEAHRFAITGHRSRRKRARATSALEQIPGIGAKRRQRLLREFGGLQAVARAGVEDLSRVRGIDRALAQAIYDAFRQ